MGKPLLGLLSHSLPFAMTVAVYRSLHCRFGKIHSGVLDSQETEPLFKVWALIVYFVAF